MHRENFHLLHHLKHVEGVGVHPLDLEELVEGLHGQRVALLHPEKRVDSSMGLVKGVEEGQ